MLFMLPVRCLSGKRKIISEKPLDKSTCLWYDMFCSGDEIQFRTDASVVQW